MNYVTLNDAIRPSGVMPGAQNGMVLVRDGNIAFVLKTLKRSLAENGTSKLVLRNDSRLYAYSRPAVRRRKKSLAARSRLKKIAGKIARHDCEGGDRAA